MWEKRACCKPDDESIDVYEQTIQFKFLSGHCSSAKLCSDELLTLCWAGTLSKCVSVFLCIIFENSI